MSLGTYLCPGFDPQEALSLGAIAGARVQLVLTDIVMPGGNGRELATRLGPLCPSAKFLFMSGYADDAIERLDVPPNNLLRKPFSTKALVQKIRETL